jgi:ApeA N-terminal domain 1
MDVYSAEGVWWRPEASQHRVPGTLTSDEDGVQLVVYGLLRPSIPANVGVVKVEGSEWEATPVVHGRTRDGADITLLDVGGTAGDRCLWHAGGTAGENDEARA